MKECKFDVWVPLDLLEDVVVRILTFYRDRAGEEVNVAFNWYEVVPDVNVSVVAQVTPDPQREENRSSDKR